jgi:hypothetical protein
VEGGGAGRQVLLVNNVAFAPANASTAFASLAALSNNYSTDGFAFGAFLGSDKGHLVGSGGAWHPPWRISNFRKVSLFLQAAFNKRWTPAPASSSKGRRQR